MPVALAVTPDAIHVLSESYGPGGGGAPAAGPGTMARHWRWRFTEFLDNVKAVTLLGNPQVACVCVWVGGGGGALEKPRCTAPLKSPKGHRPSAEE